MGVKALKKIFCDFFNLHPAVAVSHCRRDPELVTDRNHTGLLSIDTVKRSREICEETKGRKNDKFLEKIELIMKPEPESSKKSLRKTKRTVQLLQLLLFIKVQNEF